MVDLGRDRGDLGADVRRDVALDEIVDVVEADERADILGLRAFVCGLIRSCWASLMIVRLAPPTCRLAPLCVRRPETIWMISSIW